MTEFEFANQAAFNSSGFDLDDVAVTKLNCPAFMKELEFGIVVAGCVATVFNGASTSITVISLNGAHFCILCYFL